MTCTPPTTTRCGCCTSLPAIWPRDGSLVVGTYRGDDAARSGTDVILTKLAREGRVMPLRGLTESQVGLLVEQIAGEPAGESSGP